MLVLLAQAADPAADPAQRGSLVGGFAPLILIGLFFLVIWLPAMRRQKREAADTLASVKAGAKVVLSSGIVGTVVKAADGEDEIVVRSEDTRLRVLRSTVTRVVKDDADVKA